MSQGNVPPQVLYRCPKCRGLMSAEGIHAPRWAVRDGKTVRVDCVGEEVKGGS